MSLDAATLEQALRSVLLPAEQVHIPDLVAAILAADCGLRPELSPELQRAIARLPAQNLAVPGALISFGSHSQVSDVRVAGDIAGRDIVHVTVNYVPSGAVPATGYRPPLALPPLPADFLERAPVRDELQGALARSAGALVAIHGMGGVGKSVLAAALCHDPATQAAFPDGIVWVTAGREPGGQASLLQAIGQALGAPPEYLTSETAAHQRVQVLLRERTALIVMDDVWHVRQVELLLVAQPRARIVFTTRDRTIAMRVGAAVVGVGPLTATEATTYLQLALGRDDPSLAKVAQRLGGLPLALRLVLVRLRDGVAPATWLREFREIAQLRFGRRSTDPQENLAVCFALSLEALDAGDREHFAALAIIPRQRWAPDDVAVRLWRQADPGLSAINGQELLAELARLALIDADAAARRFTLHDLLHDYAGEQLAGRQQAAHRDLLAAYNLQRRPWTTLANDGYMPRHLAHHLLGAGLRDELVQLLTANPAWRRARAAAEAGGASFFSDLDLTLASFGDPLDAVDVLAMVRLLAVSVDVLAEIRTYETADLVALVWLGRVEEALSYARLRPLVNERFRDLVQIALALHDRGLPATPVLAEGLEMVRAFGVRATDLLAPLDVLPPIAHIFGPAAADREARELRALAEAAVDAHQRFIALLRLAEAMARAGLDKAGQALALHVVERPLDENERGLAVRRLAALGLLDRAAELARSAAADREMLLAHCAQLSAERGETERAVGLAAEVSASIASGAADPPRAAILALLTSLGRAGASELAAALLTRVAQLPYADDARAALALGLTFGGNAAAAHEVAATISSPGVRVATLAAMIESRVPEMSAHTATTVQAITDTLAQLEAGQRQESNRRWCMALARIGFLPVLAFPLVITWSTAERQALRDAVASACAEQGRLDDAQTALRIEAYPPAGRAMVCTVSVQFARAGRPEEAAAMFDGAERRGPAVNTHLPILSALAVMLARYGAQDQVEALLAHVSAAVEVVESHQERDALRVYHGLAQAQVGAADAAIATTRAVAGFHRAAATHRVAAVLATHGDDARATQLSSDLEGSWRQSAVHSVRALMRARSGESLVATTLLDEAVAALHRRRAADEYFMCGETAGAAVSAASTMSQSFADGDLRALIWTFIRLGHQEPALDLARAAGLRDAALIELARCGALASVQALLDSGAARDSDVFDASANEATIRVELACGLAAAGRVEEAVAMLSATASSADRRRLSIVLARAGWTDSAETMLDQVEADRAIGRTPAFSTETMRETVSLLPNPDGDSSHESIARAEIGQLAAALRSVPVSWSARLVGALAALAPAIDRIRPGLAIDAIGTALELMGQTDLRWSPAAELLTTIVRPLPAVAELTRPAAPEPLPADPLCPLGDGVTALIRFEQARALRVMGENAAAAAALSQAIAADPRPAVYHTWRAALAWERHALRSCLDGLTVALERELRPGVEASLRLWRGRLLRALGHGPAGMAELRRAVVSTPNHSLTHFAVGLALAEDGEHGGAREQLTRSMTLQPDGATAYWRGICAGAAQDWEAAIADLDNSMALDPGEDSVTYAGFWRSVFTNRAQGITVVGAPPSPDAIISGSLPFFHALVAGDHAALITATALRLQQARDPYSILATRTYLILARHMLPERQELNGIEAWLKQELEYAEEQR